MNRIYRTENNPIEKIFAELLDFNSWQRGEGIAHEGTKEIEA